MTPAFEIQDLTVEYGATPAVVGVGMSAAPGEIIALLGPNGAGKSTLLKVLSTAVLPGSGLVRVFGHDTGRDPVAARRLIGVVFQESTLDTDLTVERNLWFHARLFGMSKAMARQRIGDVLDQFGLTERRRQRVEELSGGLARRLEIARALIHRPRLVILDEPTTGLDPEARRAVWNDLRALRDDSQVTVLYATHYLDEAELADQVVILQGGRIVRRGSPGELKTGLPGGELHLSTSDDAVALRELCQAGFAARALNQGVAVRCERPETRVAEVVRALSVAVTEVAVREPTLDDVYFATTFASAGLS